MADKDPLVSVVIPMYNGERFIAEAIDSVMQQTYQSFEIVVVDDGSQDDSKAVVSRYLADGRVKLVEHAANKGIPAARNTGIRASSGEFIAFLDQDDLWMAEKLELQVRAFQTGPDDLGLVFGNLLVEQEGELRQWGGATRVPDDLAHLTSSEVLKQLFLRNFVPMVTVVVSRGAAFEVGLLDESLSGGADDYDFCLRVAARKRIAFVSSHLAIRRQHGLNFSDETRFMRDNESITKKLITVAPFLMRLRNRRRSLMYYHLGRHLQEKGFFTEAIEALWKAITLWPGHRRALAALALCALGPLGVLIIRACRRVRRNDSALGHAQCQGGAPLSFEEMSKKPRKRTPP